jgi:hypothetical protein
MDYFDPYRVLGVSQEASIADIRRAYRDLAKKYHPDVNADAGAAAMTAKINAAYDLLIDPDKKVAYDNRYSFASDEQDEGLIETDRAEDDETSFTEEEGSQRREATKKKEQRQARMYNIARVICYPIAFLSLLVILDYFLPVSTELDYPLFGYQKSTYGKYSDVSSYMKTAEYEFQVPNTVHIDYDYKSEEKKLLCMEFTPIFNTLKRIGVDHGEYALMYKAPGTVYHYLFFPIPYILLFVSIFFIREKQYTPLRYSFSFVPVVIAVVFFIMMIMS